MIAATQRILQVQNPCPHYAKHILYTRLFAEHSLNVKGLSNDTIQSLLESVATPPTPITSGAKNKVEYFEPKTCNNFSTRDTDVPKSILSV